MRIAKNKIIFEHSDRAFLQKVGVVYAAEMVLDYKTVNATPFIYDADQLSRFFMLGKKDLFSLLKNIDAAYRPILLQKKNGKSRQIYAPNDRLKHCQKRILQDILTKLPVSEYATAYRKGGTLLKNTAPHVGKRYILKLDITDFFGSICFEQVYSAAFHTGYYPKQVGVMLTKLCCRKNALPQGAPTSPALSNLVMRNFDNSIGKWCKKRGIAYTRYCDDMTFSADAPLFAVYQKAKGMLNEMGFSLNERKTHFLTDAGRQSVTGLTVNEKVAVPRGYKQALRQEIYYALKFGAAESILHADRKVFMTDDVPNPEAYCNSLLGRVGFVLQIEPGNTWFQTAFEQLKTRKIASNSKGQPAP